MSCSIEVLCLPTFAAPAMRRSRLTRNAMPSFSATACASPIIAAARVRVASFSQMSTRVARVRALIGLKLRLPQSLSQISARMSSRTGALKPARPKHSDTRVARSLRLPSSSPSGSRSPSMCATTPGATSSEAGYTTQPSTCSGGRWQARAPSGSTLCTTVPASGPPWRWKYQNGMPFCIVTMTVSGPMRRAASAATLASWCAFTARTTTSCTPTAA